MAKSLGFLVPRTCVTNDPAVAEDFHRHLGGRVVYKTLTANRVEVATGLGLVYTTKLPPKPDFQTVALAPCLFQEQILKECDIRVTVIGRAVFAVSIDSQASAISEVDWRHEDVQNLTHRLHQLPQDIQEHCLEIVDRFGLNFGAIDLVLGQDGGYYFLEINPNGQWAWLQQLCPDIPLRETLAELLIAGGKVN